MYCSRPKEWKWQVSNCLDKCFSRKLLADKTHTNNRLVLDLNDSNWHCVSSRDLLVFQLLGAITIFSIFWQRKHLSHLYSILDTKESKKLATLQIHWYSSEWLALQSLTTLCNFREESQSRCQYSSEMSPLLGRVKVRVYFGVQS